MIPAYVVILRGKRGDLVEQYEVCAKHAAADGLVTKNPLGKSRYPDGSSIEIKAGTVETARKCMDCLPADYVS